MADARPRAGLAGATRSLRCSPRRSRSWCCVARSPCCADKTYPRLTWLDAPCSAPRATSASPVRLVLPRTLLRWHAHLVAHRWTHPRRPQAARHPPADPDPGAADGPGEPTWGYRRILGKLLGSPPHRPQVADAAELGQGGGAVGDGGADFGGGGGDAPVYVADLGDEFGGQPAQGCVARSRGGVRGISSRAAVSASSCRGGLGSAVDHVVAGTDQPASAPRAVPVRRATNFPISHSSRASGGASAIRTVQG